ncbi:MAG: hypothetical protein GEV05_05265 [Betaproteobacteria bacterium]|nr:hypothetical protein [Betaproteobacteria bacterium]
MRRALAAFSVLLLCACVQLPPSPQDLQAKRFEAVPDKAVIYIVRQPMDSTEYGALLMDTGEQVTLFPGTFYRWEVPAGARRISGLGPWNVLYNLDVEPGRIYFLRYTVAGTPRMGPILAGLEAIGEQQGRRLVQQAELVR